MQAMSYQKLVNAALQAVKMDVAVAPCLARPVLGHQRQHTGGAASQAANIAAALQAVKMVVAVAGKHAPTLPRCL